MRQRWLRTLALSLGVLVMGRGTFLRADDVAPNIHPYPPVNTPPPVVSSAEKPDQRAGEDAESVPAASLNRPVPLREERPVVDAKIQPTGLFSSSGGDAFAVNSAGSSSIARPLPPGPSSGNTNLPIPSPAGSSPPPPDVPYSWRQPATPFATSQNGSSSLTMPMPSPVPGSSMVPGSALPSGTIVSPSIVSSPGTIVSPGIGSPQGTIVTPGIASAPGIVAGPTSAPLVEGSCMGDDCGASGCCTPGCCTPGCCTPNCCDAGCCDGGCSWSGCCDGCGGNDCCFGNRWFGSAEYLLWFIRGQTLPPLLTTGSATGDPLGALGQPGTATLFGGNNYENNPYSGLRLRGGYWFDDCHLWGADLGGFFLGSGTNSFFTSSPGVPILDRPFFSTKTGMQDSQLLANPAGLSAARGIGLGGSFSAVNSFLLYGAEANLRRNLCCGCNWFIDGFVGWRLLGLTESLSMQENVNVVSPASTLLPNGSSILAGSQDIVRDRFGTSNVFNGAQIGGVGEYRFGRWSVNLRTSLALGGTQQFVNVAGSTTSLIPGAMPATLPGGLLTQSSNIGPHTRSMVSFVDEVGLNLGYQFTNHIRGFVGYNFLFWSSVVRPGQQIDTVINPNLLPGSGTFGGPNRPAFSFNGADFWVQGVTAGLDIRW